MRITTKVPKFEDKLIPFKDVEVGKVFYLKTIEDKRIYYMRTVFNMFYYYEEYDENGNSLPEQQLTRFTSNAIHLELGELALIEESTPVFIPTYYLCVQ